MNNNEEEISEKKPPKHIGLIMDGNRRWAKERNLLSVDGHRMGYKVMKEMPDWFFDLGVDIVSVYAFSTENWHRGRQEVNYLMKMIKLALLDDLEDFHKKNIKLLLSGKLSELPGDLPDLCQAAIEKTKNNSKGVLNICLNYGGREEIVAGIRKIVKKNLEPGQIHEGIMKKYLYQSSLPDPDIIVRTSGEKRLSGFLLWECAYSELLFLKKFWPDFEKTDAQMIVDEYSRRNRRLGAD